VLQTNIAATGQQLLRHCCREGHLITYTSGVCSKTEPYAYTTDTGSPLQAASGPPPPGQNKHAYTGFYVTHTVHILTVNIQGVRKVTVH
jgi:hypothetical protein